VVFRWCFSSDLVLFLDVSAVNLDPTYNNAEILPYDIPSSYQYKIYRKDRKERIDKNDGGVLIMAFRVGSSLICSK
jgi:hypothetical protein